MLFGYDLFSFRHRVQPGCYSSENLWLVKGSLMADLSEMSEIDDSASEFHS